MSETILTCNECDELFADYFENDLGLEQKAGVDAHVASCARCQGLVRDLDDIRETAGSMPDLVPSRDLWQGIEARIQPTVVSIAPRRSVAAIPGSWLATAAAGLIVVSSSVTYVATSRTMQKEPKQAPAASAPARVAGATVEATLPSSSVAAPSAAARETTPAPRIAPAPVRRAPRAVAIQASARSVPPAERVLSEEIDELQTLLDTKRGNLEPETVRVVEENLAIIDAAVSQAREAVSRDPGSGFLNERLESALQKKVQLLRTVALIRSST